MTHHYKKGFIALITIVIISATTLLLVLGASGIGLGELDSGFSDGKSGEAFAIAEGCIDEVLRRLHLDSNYGVGAGTINLSVHNGSCTIEVTANASERTINVTGTADDFNKSLRVVATVSGGTVTLDSWSEVEI